MGLMTGKRGLIMGLANDKSIAWGIAKAVADEGAELAFSYQGEQLLKRVKPLAEQVGSSIVLPCDVGDAASLDALFATLEAEWGSLDFVVHAIGFSDKNELRGRYVDTSPAQFRHDDGHLGLFLHRRLPARGEDDAEWRLAPDADLFGRGKGHAALQRHGRGQGGAGGLASCTWPRIWAATASA
jgi:NAD(P)-dependent dehydrogenase (short-subunit alcohol dehydrogenase family)